MASPLARRYIDTAKGSGAKSREWRVYLLGTLYRSDGENPANIRLHTRRAAYI